VPPDLSPPTKNSVLILCPTLPLATSEDPHFQWVRTTAGQSADDHGQSQLSLLPMDREVVLVVPPQLLSWHRVNPPKVPAKRLRAVLEGLLEDQLLDEVANVHLAVEPGIRPGQPAWVCVCHRAWLRELLQRLESGQRPVSRIVPAIWPEQGTSGGLTLQAFSTGDGAWLAASGSDGVALAPLEDSTGPQVLDALGLKLEAEDSGVAPPMERLADPSVLGLAESRLQQRFEPLPLASQLLRSAGSPWNLAQFDLSLSSGARMGQRWRQNWRNFVHSAEWRPARWGLVTLVVAALGGLNTSAWMEQRILASKTRAVEQTLRDVFPEVTVVIDAPVQMRQELQRLRRGGGTLGPQDLEALLAVVGRAMPTGMAPPTRLLYDGRWLVLGGWTGTGESLEALRATLESQGLQSELQGADLRVAPGQE
jgi:general secretion pathway protein L